MTLYLFEYNNYYNRIVKKLPTIQDYEEAGTLLDSITNVNFLPNDGISTEHIINYDANTGNYVIITDGPNDEIVSRWFVIESVRVRVGQYKLILYRDVIADWYDEIVAAPMFVEKATLQQSDPLIFNSEDMTFNQIKTSENLIKDETKSAWLVGYCTRDTEETSISADIKYHAPVDIAVSNINAYKYYNNSNLVNNPQPLSGFPEKITYNVYALYNTSAVVGGKEIVKTSFNKQGRQPTGNYNNSSISGYIVSNGNGYAYPSVSDAFRYRDGEYVPDPYTTWPAACLETGYTMDSSADVYTAVDTFIDGFTNYYSTLETQLPAYLTVSSQEEALEIQNQNGKTIYDEANDDYYQITVEKSEATESETMISSGAMYNTFVNAVKASAAIYDSEWSWREPGDFVSEIWGGNPSAGSFSVRTTGVTYKIILNKLPDQSLTYTASLPDDRYQLEDAPYDMFCMPFSDDLDIYKNNVLKFKSSKSLAWQTFMSLAAKYKNAGFIYDIQLLPYCPVRYCIKNDRFDVGSNVVGKVTKTESGQTSDVAYILFGTKASDNFVVPYSITIDDNKVQGQTDLWRLVSPNYSGQFEFNAAKNNGVEYIDIDFTYKPYTPYIHLSPNFKNLYGQDYNDARGLICGGDYSLPSISSAWDTYELQNKNYQLAFDRQIQNMEVQNKYQKTMDIVNAITGTASGGVTGAIGGGLAGGAYGAIAGGIIGTVGAAAGGIADVTMKNTLRKEAIDYAKDQFGYQLGNIQALPYTLNKVSAFNANNKIFPFIEYYTCTQTEKDALIDKIRYNGMTVGKIGKIQDYLRNTYRDFEHQYIKGKLIRLESEEDFHIVNTIAEELNKGVFI